MKVTPEEKIVRSNFVVGVTIHILNYPQAFGNGLDRAAMVC